MTTDSLYQDIENLVSSSTAEFTRNPWDPSIRVRLKALLDLQAILKSQQLPPHQLQAVRDQVTQLQRVSSNPIPAPVPAPAPIMNPYATAPSSHAAYSPPIQVAYQPATPPVLLPPAGTLADLLAVAARAKQTPVSVPTNAQIPLRQPQLPPPQQSPHVQPASTGGADSLLASLRAAGLIPPSRSTPVNGQSALGSTMVSYGVPDSISTPPVQLASLVKVSTIEQRNSVELISASLKMYGLDLMAF